MGGTSPKHPKSSIHILPTASSAASPASGGISEGPAYFLCYSPTPALERVRPGKTRAAWDLLPACEERERSCSWKPRKWPQANVSLQTAAAWLRHGGGSLLRLLGSRAEEHGVFQHSGEVMEGAGKKGNPGYGSSRSKATAPGERSCPGRNGDTTTILASCLMLERLASQPAFPGRRRC